MMNVVAINPTHVARYVLVMTDTENVFDAVDIVEKEQDLQDQLCNEYNLSFETIKDMLDRYIA